MTNSARILFVGLGSPHGDDQIGWRIADELNSQVAELPMVTVRKATVPLDLMDWLEGVDQLHLCDACCTGEPTGTVLRLDASPAEGNQPRLQTLQTLEYLRSTGTHDFDLAAVLELASRLAQLPAKVVIHAVPGCRFEAGATMTDELAENVSRMAQSILEELSDARTLTRAVTAASG